MASQSGVFNLQEFTSLGDLAVAGRIYTYAPGTTTQKTAYTDSAGATPHTYTNDGLGGQYIPLDARGELPAPLFLSSGGYDITLKTSAGSTVWTRRAVGVADAAAALDTETRADLADDADAANGAGMVGEDLSLNYVAGTIGWWDKHAGVSLLRYIPINLLAGVVAGTNTTDLTAYVQSALTDALTTGCVITGHGYTYKCDSPLTWLRSSAGHSKTLTLQCARFDCSELTGSEVALTVGAGSTTYFIEDGRIILNEVTFIGPEDGDPRDTSAATTTTGLAMTFAGGVSLYGVNCFGFYKGYYSKFAFPVQAVNCNFRRSWIGAHFDEASNLQTWMGLTLPNCRYGILIRSESTALDSGKSNTLTFVNPWIEGTCVGMVIDSDAGTPGIGAVRHRGIKVVAPYLSSPAGSVNPSDFFRIGTRWALANPVTRGADCTEFISDVEFDFTGGLINPDGGLFSATQALAVFDTSNARCSNFQMRAIATSVRIDSDTFVNNPRAGWARTAGYPGVSDGLVEEMWWDNGAIVRRHWANGGDTVGAKTAQSTIAQIGAELGPAGFVSATADGAQTFDFNRLTSDGTIGQFRRSSVSVGSIGVTTTATAYNTSSDYRLKSNVQPIDGEAALTAVMSWPIRSFTWNANGAPGVGVIAHELQAVEPDAVHGQKDGAEMQGVDYSKLVPKLVAAVQYLEGRLSALENQ